MALMINLARIVQSPVKEKTLTDFVTLQFAPLTVGR
jgi:hypothetical protein